MGTNNLKIVVIGAGSFFFGRQVIWAAQKLEGLRGCALTLVDTDPEHLEKMVRLGRMAAESAGSGTRVEGADDYREALPGADFVVLSFSERNAHYREIDCRISARYGIRMCSGDTIGPGGVFRAMRELPKILEIAAAVEEHCPDAWLINYVNPSAVMGIGLMRHSGARTFALCDSHHLPGKKRAYLRMLGLPQDDLESLDMRIAGVNHFTFMLSAHYKGEDIRPQIREAFRRLGREERDDGYSKARFNNFITAQLSDLFGAIPTCTGHTKEYLPFYQGRGAICEPIPSLAVFDARERARGTAVMWEEIDDYISGKKPMDGFFEKYRSDHATDIIQTMVTGNGRHYFINRPNCDCAEGGGRAVENLPEDAFLELECRLDAGGPRPLPVGSFPLGLRSLQMQILDVHELTVEAIVRRDRRLLVRALALDPLVQSIATAEAVIDDLFAAQRPVLGAWSDAESSDSETASATTATAPQLY